MLISCKKEQTQSERGQMTGGPCGYDEFAAFVVIDSVSADGNSVHFSVSSNSDDEILRKALGYYNFNTGTINPDCVSANLFSAGDTLAAQVDIITSGTCTPVILKILDNAECFMDYGR